MIQIINPQRYLIIQNNHASKERNSQPARSSSRNSKIIFNYNVVQNQQLLQPITHHVQRSSSLSPHPVNL